MPLRFNPKDCIDTRNRVYLVLGTPLGDDETPDVHIVGTVRDEAGNAGASDRPTWKLKTGSLPRSRSASPETSLTTDGRPLAREEITVNDRRPANGCPAAPTVWLVSFDHTGKITDAYDS